MAERTAWTGAVNFGGFPIHLAAYSAVESKGADSFKTLCPCHQQPIKQHRVCATTGEIIENDAALKGVELAKHVYVLEPDAVEAIRKGESTESLDVERFAPLDSVPIHLAESTFKFTANPKVAQSEQAANILWNGLHESGRAAIVEPFMPRSSSRPKILVIYAGENEELIGLTLPYTTALKQTPKGGFAPDDRAAAMFEAFITAQDYSTDAFDHSAYVDMYRERRDEIVAKAIKGEPVDLPDAPAAPKAAGPDLMAAMEAAMGAAKPAPKKAAKKVKATA